MIFGNDELMDIYRTDFMLIKEHNHDQNALDEMMPFERQIVVFLLLEYIEKLNQARS